MKQTVKYVEMNTVSCQPLLSRPALRISGKYVEQMGQERKEILFSKGVDIDEETKPEGQALPTKL